MAMHDRRGEGSGQRPSRAPERPTEGLAARAAVALQRTLGTRRWFGDKDRDVSAVVSLDHTAVPGTSGLLALFDVIFADGGRQRYCIPIGPSRGSPEPFVDAMADPEFCLALLEAIRRDTTLAGAHGVFQCTATPVLAELIPAMPREVRPITK